MPKIQWTGLPPALRDHLFERLRERKITAEDLYQLKAWRESGTRGAGWTLVQGLRLLQDLRRRTVSEDVSAPRPTRQRGKTLDRELKGDASALERLDALRERLSRVERVWRAVSRRVFNKGGSLI